MTERDFTPTMSLFLELKEERQGMQEGYRFLDEKRLILAAEILQELSRYESESAAFNADYATAAAALSEAVGRHGVEGLSVYPPSPPMEAEMDLRSRSVLGVTVHELQCQIAAQTTTSDTAMFSPEAVRCTDAFRALIPRAAQLAVLAGNLERLREDYARTARRARAMEDVLLPEIDEALSAIDGALEELEREEAVRARSLTR